MKSAFVNALLTMILLGSAIGLMGRYFNKISSEYAIFVIYGTGLLLVSPLAYGLAKMDGATLNAPTTAVQVLGIAACGAMIAFADYFGVKAFNSGGSTVLVASVIGAAPAFAAILGVVLGGHMPGVKPLAGLAIIIVGVVLVRSELPPVEEETPDPAASATPADKPT